MTFARSSICAASFAMRFRCAVPHSKVVRSLWHVHVPWWEESTKGLPLNVRSGAPRTSQVASLSQGGSARRRVGGSARRRVGGTRAQQTHSHDARAETSAERKCATAKTRVVHARVRSEEWRDDFSGRLRLRSLETSNVSRLSWECHVLSSHTIQHISPSRVGPRRVLTVR